MLKKFNTQLGPLIFQSVSVGSYGSLMRKNHDDRMLSSDTDALWWNNDLSKYKPYSDYWNTMLLTGGHFCNIPNARKEFNCDYDKTLVFADSGGFQLRTGKGIIQKFMYDENGDMSIYAPNSANSSNDIRYSNDSLKRILEWQENNSDIFINLDLPPSGEYRNKFNYALEVSSKHFKYYADHRQKSDKILLNVLHGYNVPSIMSWYDEMKQYPFDGWSSNVGAFGIYTLMLKIATLLQNGEFAKESCKVFHILGATALYYILIMARLQHHFNDYTNNRLQVTCDSSLAGLSGVYGRLFATIDYKNLNYVSIKVPQSVSDKNVYTFNKSFKLPFSGYEVSADKVIPKYKLANDVIYNNIICIYNSTAQLYEYAKYPLDMLYKCKFMNNLYISLLESIDKMFDAPEHAIDIIHQYKHVYDKLQANSVSDGIDDNVLNEFFN